MDREAFVQTLTACRLCPRLVAWREEVVGRKRAFRGEPYWARPVPGFGDPEARILLFGLAPGAHGSNRTGRPFTGDASGAFLYPLLHEAGLSSKPESLPGDDLRLYGVYLTAAVRCAPPKNKPTPEELRACARWTEVELGLLPEVRVYVALGRIALGGPPRPLRPEEERPPLPPRGPLPPSRGKAPPRELPRLPAEHPDGQAHPGDVPGGPDGG